MKLAEAESELGKDYLKAFRTRARSLPTMLYTNGLSYTIVYVASRSSHEAVEIGLISESCEDLLMRLESLLAGRSKAGGKSIDKEEAGYILYGSLLAYLLKTARFTTVRKFDELVRAALDDALLNQGANLVAEWIKRLAEAYIPE